jgi:hypothetical protein
MSKKVDKEQPAINFTLRITPYAWAKIRWIRDHCKSEIAGFGISSSNDPFLMEDFATIQQTASSAHFTFDDNALNTYLSKMFEAGKQPAECMRLWIHTHPTNNFAAPSGTDEDTFSRATGKADWGVMIIVDEGDNIYASLKIKAGETMLRTNMPIEIVYTPPFRGVTTEDIATWQKEAEENIKHPTLSTYADKYFNIFKEHDYYELGGYPSSHPVLSGVDSVAEITPELLLLDPVRVVRVCKEKSGGWLVLTDGSWFIYENSDTEILCKAGEHITTTKQIADVCPSRFGELEWLVSNGSYEPIYVSEVSGGRFIYFDDVEDEVNDGELEFDELVGDTRERFGNMAAIQGGTT